MDWFPIFASFGSSSSVFDEICNEPNSPIKNHCTYSFNYDGVQSIFNTISTSQQQNTMRKIVMKQSHVYSKSAVDNMKIMRGCHCKQTCGRQKPSNQKYWWDENGVVNKNKCVNVSQCG